MQRKEAAAFAPVAAAVHLTFRLQEARLMYTQLSYKDEDDERKHFLLWEEESKTSHHFLESGTALQAFHILGFSSATEDLLWARQQQEEWLGCSARGSALSP